MTRSDLSPERRAFEAVRRWLADPKGPILAGGLTADALDLLRREIAREIEAAEKRERPAGS